MNELVTVKFRSPYEELIELQKDLVALENLDDLDPSEKKRILDEVKSILGIAVQDETITEGLRRAARDINLGRALRERGIMRLYRILETDYQTEDGVALPAYTFLINPDTGERFSNKEHLIR